MTAQVIRRVRARSLTVVVLAMGLLFAASYQAFGKGASLSVSIKPPRPSANSTYTLTISGKATKGHLGNQRNRSEIDRVEQIGGSCASTPQAELKKTGIQDLGPVFVKKGPFSITQKRTATPAAHTTIRFCVYLSSKLHKLKAASSAAYTTP